MSIKSTVVTDNRINANVSPPSKIVPKHVTLHNLDALLQINNLSDLENVTAAKTSLGLENVTNESKAEMFTNPTFTGNLTTSGNIESTGGSLIIANDAAITGDLTIGGNTVLGNATSDTTSISGGLIVDTDTLVVDESNNRVGINNSGPSEALDVAGNIVSNSTISGNILTDGTASINGGAITGATDISATDISATDISATNITASANVTGADPTLSTHLATKNYVDTSGLGVGQTWQEVTRDLHIGAFDGTETSYTNDTGKPIEVKGAFYTGTDAHQIKIAVTPSGGSEFELVFSRGTNSGGGVYSNGSIIIPNNTSYKFRKTGTGSLVSFEFAELR